ncbi:N-6 DNA methylase [Klebsiella pneumoniae]|uniref:N-6 DNA methylase n=1 Tax=Klebsiella pneumoniae TaxID=573 RepID=A0A2X1QFE9_KLEPN|nr:N-6 DNA methylase [Klebsiella pneumoniae]
MRRLTQIVQLSVFMVPRIDIEAENYDLSLSRYKEEIFEEVQYEQPEAILERLIQAEVGNVDKKVLNKVQSGILYELLELKGMIV